MSFRRVSRALLAIIALLSICCVSRAIASPSDDRFAQGVEAARRSHDEKVLQFLKTELTSAISKDSANPTLFLDLARVLEYFVDICETRKDRKSAVDALDKAIDAALKSIQLNDKSADTHSLLADLYGRKIQLGNGMFAGPKFGPKVKDENAKAMALDDKNPRVWASLGRQYLMAPKMFGGDMPKAIESLEKSIALDSQQDETFVWLARAYAKQGDKAKAREAIQRALQLNPQSQFAKDTAASLEK
jgi:tetratricopeptide (TPR) repeat protein